MNERIVPPFSFGYVEKDVFRGAYPVSLNFKFLEGLHLKTMISLVPNELDDELREFCKSHGIVNHLYQVPPYTGQIVITATTIVEILCLMCKSDSLPLYIHSVDGEHINGLVIMCLRKLQMWSTQAIFSDFNQYVPDSFESCEEAFVHKFTATFELPPPRPAWLSHVSGKHSHPALRVYLPDEPESDSSEEDVEEEQNTEHDAFFGLKQRESIP